MRRPKSMTVKEDEDVQFTCKFIDLGDGKVHWKKDGEIITQSSRVMVGLHQALMYLYISSKVTKMNILDSFLSILLCPSSFMYRLCDLCPREA